MRRFLFSAVLVFLTIPINGTAQQRLAAVSDSNESRIALVIGNANYKDAPLANPLNDARAVAKALNDAGFQVKVHTNLTQAQMRRTIREFGDELHAKQGVGLFYFAGHGVQISNRNFLIPVGADIQREYEVEDQAVDAGSVLAMMESAKARVNIVILDACRNNPFMRNFRSAINGLAPMQAPAGTLVAFSTAPGQTAIDGSGQYGLYTEHLVENLTLPGLKIEDVFKNVRVGVQRASGSKQVPWENTSLTGDFYFRAPPIAEPATTVASSAGPAPAVSRDEIDRAVQAALRKREEDQAARQLEIERAVLAALQKREQDQEAAIQAKKSRQEIDDARSAIARLKRELAELQATREAERAQDARQEVALPAISRETAQPQGVKPRADAKPAIQPAAPASAPQQISLAAPASPRQRPVINVGGRVEPAQARTGDQWRYQVTDGFTRERSAVAMEVVRITESRVYTQKTNIGSVAADRSIEAGGGTLEVWDRSWNLLREGSTDYSPSYPLLKFPLEVGKTWRENVVFTDSAGMALIHNVTATVIGWERIAVPAGTFDAVKISFRGSFQASGGGFIPGSGSINDTYWYAPAIQQIVVKDLSHSTTDGLTGSSTSAASLSQLKQRWELLDYKLN